jgi:hypothetical protein
MREHVFTKIALKGSPLHLTTHGHEDGLVKDKYGRQVAGVGRLVGFSVVALLLGILFVVWGVSRGGGSGLVEIVLAVVIWVALSVLWVGVAVTQRKRRDLQPRD